jgi:flagellar hook-associated protein 1
MSLTQALNTAISGLRVTQAGLSVVAGNVANADTAGYVRKTTSQVATAAGDFGIGVRTEGINRELDVYVQKQLQIESSGAAYAGARADFYARLQQIYGEPGSDAALETTFNKFTEAVQALATTPDASSTRSIVLSTAQVLAQHLNGITSDLQSLRSDAELQIADAVRSANEAIAKIADLNKQLAALQGKDATAAALQDQRDGYISQLSELMDIRVTPGTNNQVSVSTASGLQLVSFDAAEFNFDAHGMITAGSLWNSDAAERGVGTITLQTPTGAGVDLIATHAFRSGKIAALIEMRDHILPQAQAQLDEIAAGMASALSDRTVAGTPVNGAQDGFDVDVGSLLPGNRIDISYRDLATGALRQVSVLRVDDPNALPLNEATPDGSHRTVGVNFSGGIASVVAQLNVALGGQYLDFSNPAGNVLRILDDGGTNHIDVTAASATSTVTSLTGGVSQLPFFVDGADPYTGAITVDGKQSVGFAGRIAVNSTLMADPSRLVVYNTSPLTPGADPTRPTFISDQLTRATRTFAPGAGIGSPEAPFTGSLSQYMRQMISQQGDAAQGAASLKEGQELVVKSLQQRFNDLSGVNVDNEMATLLKLQNSYAANARIMSTINQLFDVLMRM